MKTVLWQFETFMVGAFSVLLVKELQGQIQWIHQGNYKSWFDEAFHFRTEEIKSFQRTSMSLKNVKDFVTLGEQPTAVVKYGRLWELY